MSKPGEKKERKKKLREERQKKRRQTLEEYDRIDGLYFQAENAAGNQQWQSVVQKCVRIIGIAPNHVVTLRLLAQAYHNLKNFEDELNVLRKLNERCPKDREISQCRIVAEVNANQYEETLTQITRFENEFPVSKKEATEFKRLREHCKTMIAVKRYSAAKPASPVPVIKTGKKAGDEDKTGIGITQPAPSNPQKKQKLTTDLPRTVPQISIMIDVVRDDSFFHAAPLEKDSLFWLRQRLRYAHLRMQSEFEELICIPHLKGVYHFTYQAETVRKVLKIFRGRVLLSDEVGLGKTIEAAMVIKEYLMRGMVKTVLVLCPPSLVYQWNAELRSKFGIHGRPQNNVSDAGRGATLWSHDIVIASIHTAKSKSNSELVLKKAWDMVVVDEAHHLRNRRTLAWSLVNSLRKKFILLLSATPVQNDLVELYNLITLLKPGAFPPEKEFLRMYCDPKDARVPKNAGQLRLLMRDCMIRNTRAGCGVPFPKRFATTYTVQFNDEEREIYEQISGISHRLSAQGAGRIRLSVRTLLERAGAHLPLALTTLKTIALALEADQHDLAPIGDRERLKTDIAGVAERIAHLCGVTGKIKKLKEIIGEGEQPIIVFCRHTATVEYVCGELLTAGIPYTAFHGGMSTDERTASITSFKENESRVFVSSESGGEGQNLQFCNALVNFDLPWNPMQIEQRIGRIHRIGQDRDVFVFNLCYGGTLEEKILGILETKIRMFELVVGEVDSILGGLDERGGFGEVVLDLWIKSADAGGRSRAFEELGEFLTGSRESYLDACRLDENLFGKEMEA
jgi:superfamily II DNA or RNA helicase